MSKVIIKVEFETAGGEAEIKQAINKKFSGQTIDYGTVPRIGEYVDLLEISKNYELSEEELNWLSKREHKYQIENVNKCDGYIEVELDIDKVWPEEA